MTEYRANLNEVRLSKLALIDILKENHKKHVAVYEEAVDGYWDETAKILHEALDKINKRHLPSDKEVNLYFPFPKNYSSDYQSAIEMLELSIDSTITLTAAEFQQYVKDNWTWSKTFSVTNSMYLKKNAY